MLQFPPSHKGSVKLASTVQAGRPHEERVSQDLFEDKDVETKRERPLASRMRPDSLSQFVGQEHLLGAGKLLRRALEAGRLSSLLLYGPPGSGKTTLAYLIANHVRAHFEVLNAVSATVADLRRVIREAAARLARPNGKTILFIDEIHRFTKAQQDVLMPALEDGEVILVGATVQNPSFALVGPLLSRSMVVELYALKAEEIVELLKRALSDRERGLGAYRVTVEEGALEHLARTASGDARRALNALEVGVLTTPPEPGGTIHLTREAAQESVQKRIVPYDWDGDLHYDTASAFIKSLRGSDADAAVYWLAKMLYAGEDPRFIARRLVILASEDIGNADPQALTLAVSAQQAVEFVGMPEARIILAQAVTYLALAPKSNAAYLAVSEALQDVEKEAAQEVPMHLKDSGTAAARRLGHGQGYQYAHEGPGHFVKQEYVKIGKAYYRPTRFGYEKVMAERIAKVREGRAPDSDGD